MIKAIRDEVGAGTAKTCRNILSRMCALAVTHGALVANPVREITIRAAKKKPPRALEADELEQWFELRSQDGRAIRADLVDMSKPLAAMGERVGETLAMTWRDVKRETGEADCSHQIQWVEGRGLLRRRGIEFSDYLAGLWTCWTKGAVPGNRWMRRSLWTQRSGFRDPHNVQKVLRDAADLSEVSVGWSRASGFGIIGGSRV